MNEVHREMRATLERGWSVIPLHPRSKRPLLPSWREFQERPVETWLRRWPDCNYGICTGAVSRCMVLDQDGAAGAKSLAGRELPRTPTVETHSGLHRYYDHPGWRVRNFAGILPWVDIRGDGGYVVGAGSTHPEGSLYRWQVLPDEAPFAPAPSWLLELIAEQDAVRRQGAGAGGRGTGDGSELWAPGTRRSALGTRLMPLPC